MTRARDVANVLSTATALATDTETAALIATEVTNRNSAISTHNSATTSVHGISNTANLATSTSVTSAVSTHNTAADGHFGRGTTASRPVSPSVGVLYYDTDLKNLYQYNSIGWSVAGVPIFMFRLIYDPFG